MLINTRMDFEVLICSQNKIIYSNENEWLTVTSNNMREFHKYIEWKKLLLLLLSHFSRVRLCVTPQTAAHQAPPSLGFSRREHWSGLPLPSPMHKSEKLKRSRSVVSDSSRPHGLQPTRLLHPWDFPGKSTGVGCHCILQWKKLDTHKIPIT